MATLQEVEAIANNNQSLITAIQNETVDPSSLTNAQKRVLSDGIYGSKPPIIHYESPIVAVGDKIYFNEEDALFPDFQGTARVDALPATDENNLSEVRKS